MLRVLLWKELLDLSRDKKTIMAVVVLPLIGLPGVALLSGALASTQVIKIAINIEDSNATSFARVLASAVRDYLQGTGVNAYIEVVSGAAVNPADYDLIVIIPKGFMNNITSLSGVATIRVSMGLGGSGETALNALYSAINNINNKIIIYRIEFLAEKAGVKVDPRKLLQPIRISLGYHSATGAPATPQQAEEAATSKLLSFAFLFVVDPAVVYMADSIVGEKERRTIERLLLTPLTRRDLVLGKALASYVLGFATSVIDLLALLFFFSFGGSNIVLTPSMLLVWLIISSIIIIITALIVGAISARSSSVRGAQNASFIVLTIAIAIYFTSLFVDLSKTPASIRLPLELIPYTHAVLAVTAYGAGDLRFFALHVIALLLFTLATALLAERAFTAERLVSYTE